MGEVLMQAALDRQGILAVVTSAGLMAGGVPAEAEAQAAVNQVDLDLSRHESRQLSQAIVDEADVVLTMERLHVREIAVRFGALAKTFTLKDFVQRAVEHPPSPHEPFDQWVTRLAESREKALLMGRSTADEVADPIGQPLAAFVHTRRELESLSDAAARSLRRPE